MTMKNAVLVVLVCCSSISFAEDRQILMVGSKPDHPFATHMYEHECKLLVACLNHNHGVSARYVAEWPPSDQQLESVDAIVFYSSPAGSVLLKQPNRARFDKLMRDGVGFVAIHWATGVGYDKISEGQPERDQFKSWLGGWFRRPPCDIAIDRTDLRVIDRRHPISRGWEEWKIHDEFYLDPVLHENAKPLLAITLRGQEHVVGWTFERRDEGRSVGITLGHFHHNFARAGFRRLLVNAVLWSAGVEIPEQGANVDAEPAKLALPKQVP